MRTKMKYDSVIVGLTLLSALSSCSNTCDRTPKKAGNPKPNYDRYVIEVLGNPNHYSPGDTYTIVLKSSPSNPNTNYFTEFMLVVEPDSPSEALQDTLTGDLRPVDHSIARFTPKCRNAVIQTNNLGKSNVSILWTAPPSGNGCIAIRATVYESSDSWFTDDGGLSKILCEEEENEDVQPSILEKCEACNEAKYEVAFQGLWTRNTHPKDYPPNMWTTKLGEVIGASHKYSSAFWNYDSTATDGLKLLAEEGNTTLLEDELKEMLKNDDIRTIIKARELSYPNITGTSYTVFRVDQEHHLISLVSKITPSPDWIIGVANFELCTENGEWIQSRTFNLYPWDIGTDDGTLYNSPDSPSLPPKSIKMISSDVEDTPFYNEEGEVIKPIAKLHLTRQKLYEKFCESTTKEEEDDDMCKFDEWSVWSNCSTTCGQEVMTRDRPLLKRENEANCTALGRSIEEQNTERCSKSGECEETACSHAIWDKWSPCSVTCGNGIKVRNGKLSADENIENEENQYNEESAPCSETVECYNRECDTEIESTEETTLMEPQSQVRDSIDCKVSRWSEWGPCSATEPCERGTQHKYRHVETQPQNGGKRCPETLEKSKRCRIPCSSEPVRKIKSHSTDCIMGPWSEWSPCSRTCGSAAVQQRTRSVEFYPSADGKPCGPRVETKNCPLPYSCSDVESSKLMRSL